MLLEKITSYTLISLIFISIILSIINLVQLIIFYSLRNIQTNQFLQTRKPILIIVYSILSFINSFIVLPTIIFTDTLQQKFQPFYMRTFISSKIRSYFTTHIWILTFTHEIITSILLIIIAERAWLLLYEYKYIDAYTSIEWKQIIVPEESTQNKWLKYRNTFGLHSFLSKLIFFIFLLIISTLFIIQNILYILPKYEWIVIDISIAFPLCLFILSISTLQIRKINDQFKIRK
eukprot:539138_1